MFLKSVIMLFSASALALTASTAQAAYVSPKIAGGQLSGPMVHADITFDGQDLGYSMMVMDHGHGGMGGGHGDMVVPALVALTPPDAFDPAATWAVLQGKAYNFQYAWNPGGAITLPADAFLWVERLAHDAGLEAYEAITYNPIFTADGDRWHWDGTMAHNIYAVENPTHATYEATYRVYLGDITGQALSQYGSVDVSWTWTTDAVSHHHPVPEPASAALLGLGASALLMRRWRRTA